MLPLRLIPASCSALPLPLAKKGTLDSSRWLGGGEDLPYSVVLEDSAAPPRLRRVSSLWLVLDAPSGEKKERDMAMGWIVPDEELFGYLSSHLVHTEDRSSGCPLKHASIPFLSLAPFASSSFPRPGQPGNHPTIFPAPTQRRREEKALLPRHSARRCLARTPPATRRHRHGTRRAATTTRTTATLACIGTESDQTRRYSRVQAYPPPWSSLFSFSWFFLGYLVSVRRMLE